MECRLLERSDYILFVELLRQVSSPQLLYPAAAVAVVLLSALLVFVFGFRSAEQPQFDKLPLVLDDKKSAAKKKKPKDKKSSPNRSSTDDTKTKETSKKSPSKEKKEEKVKEAEKPKPKEKAVEPKIKKEPVVDAKKAKKGKGTDAQKPEDFDDGVWEEVPKKSDKKKVKGTEDKKESPVKKNKKKTKESDAETAHLVEKPTEIQNVVISGPVVDEEAQRALQAQVEELQRVLKEAELRDQGVIASMDEDDIPAVEQLTDVKDLRSNKKKENMEKQKKQKANDVAAKAASKAEAGDKESDSSDKQDEGQNVPVFDELGDTWTEAKVPKKSKKKVRKD